MVFDAGFLEKKGGHFAVAALVWNRLPGLILHSDACDTEFRNPDGPSYHGPAIGIPVQVRLAGSVRVITARAGDEGMHCRHARVSLCR